MKTNAVRTLDRLAIRYELRTYEVDPEDLSAETVARKIGLPIAQVFKTLLLQGDRNGSVFAVVPGDAKADERAVARLTGDRRMHMAALKDIQPLTGYVRGGVTALAAAQAFPVYLDETAERHDLISVSAGVRGLQILISPGDYVRVTNATVARIGQ